MRKGGKRNLQGLSFAPLSADLAENGAKVFAALAHAGVRRDASSIKERRRDKSNAGGRKHRKPTRACSQNSYARSADYAGQYMRTSGNIVRISMSAES